MTIIRGLSLRRASGKRYLSVMLEARDTLVDIVQMQALQIHGDDDIAAGAREFVDDCHSVDLENVRRKKIEEMRVSEGGCRSIACADKCYVEVDSCIEESMKKKTEL